MLTLWSFKDHPHLKALVTYDALHIPTIAGHYRWGLPTSRSSVLDPAVPGNLLCEVVNSGRGEGATHSVVHASQPASQPAPEHMESRGLNASRAGRCPLTALGQQTAALGAKTTLIQH